MMPYDVAIWERFIEKFPSAYKMVEYDHALGSTPQFDTVVNEATGGDAAKLYQYKIDVVAELDDRIDIIELKPNAGPSALGQVNSYVALYKRDRSPQKPLRPVVITDILRTDMQHLADDAGVTLIVV